MPVIATAKAVCIEEQEHSPARGVVLNPGKLDVGRAEEDTFDYLIGEQADMLNPSYGIALVMLAADGEDLR